MRVELFKRKRLAAAYMSSATGATHITHYTHAKLLVIDKHAVPLLGNVLGPLEHMCFTVLLRPVNHAIAPVALHASPVCWDT